MLRKVLDLLIPDDCHICGHPRCNSGICPSCRPEIPETSHDGRCPICYAWLAAENTQCSLCLSFPPVYSGLRYVWEYEGRPAELIRAMKRRPSTRLCNFAARIMSQARSTLYPQMSWDYIIPIPSSRKSLEQRRFNQCQILARALCRYPDNRRRNSTGLLNTHTLLHTGKAQKQTSLSGEKRVSNAGKAFYTRGPDLNQKTVLLVDDVITSGSTSNAACQRLKLHGAGKVYILALARSKNWYNYRDFKPERITK